jgi:hypothetical protein
MTYRLSDTGSKQREYEKTCEDSLEYLHELEEDELPTIEDLKDYTDYEEMYQRECERRWPW